MDKVSAWSMLRWSKIYNAIDIYLPLDTSQDQVSKPLSKDSCHVVEKNIIIIHDYPRKKISSEVQTNIRFYFLQENNEKWWVRCLRLFVSVVQWFLTFWGRCDILYMRECTEFAQLFSRKVLEWQNALVSHR